MNKILNKRRIRAKIIGTSDRPRVTVFRSNKYLYLQAIDDKAGKTIAAASTMKDDKNLTSNFYKRLNEKKITKIVFDRAGYKYHGKVKTIAEELRKMGLEF